MRIYTCHWCTAGQHEKCELSHDCPPGQYGGSRCICPCKGDPKYLERKVEEVKKFLEELSQLRKTSGY